MIELNENAAWANFVHGYDILTPLEGGHNGPANVPLTELASRTAYLKKEVDVIKNNSQGGYLDAYDFETATPEQQALTDYALSQIGIDNPLHIWDKTRVKNLFDGNVWILSNTQQTNPPVFEWVNNGSDTVGIANNDGVAGIVKGGHGDDEVYIEPDGTMKIKTSSFQASQNMEVFGTGRDLLAVLGVATIPEAMAEIRRRCNNNGEIDVSGLPNFSGLMIGDYIDGLDLSGIAAPAGGEAPQTWNDTYKNNRIVIAGFNTYKGSGGTENTKNHILFVFENIIAKARMNSTNTNTGGYKASESRQWLEGANGDGSGVFATGLKAALGGNYLYTISKYNSIKGGSDVYNCTVFLPTEIEFFGNQTYGDELNYYNINVHFPIYQRSTKHRVKRWNGNRDWHFLATPSASSAAGFCYCSSYGLSNNNGASSVGGVAPAFCVA